MKIKIRSTIILSALVTLVTGCASVAVTSDAIEQRTAAALGLEQGSFVITDRQDEGVKTTYNVKAKNGRAFSCYVTGTFAIVGRVTSDAICTEVGGKTTTKQTGKAAPAPASSCNALLKSAGKC